MRSFSVCAWIISSFCASHNSANPNLFHREEPIHIPLNLATPSHLSLERRGDLVAFESWAIQAGNKLNARYGGLHGNGATSPDVPTSLKARQLSEITLMNAFSDAIYTGAVSIGTPPKRFNMIMDTGSADLWVADNLCTVDQGCPSSARRFDAESSSSYQNLTKVFKVQYGSGKVTGNLAKDNVSIGNMTVLGVTFGTCDVVENILRAGIDTSGIMGLGWSGIATSSSTPAWESLFLQSALREPMMSFALKRLINGRPTTIGPGGMMTIGGTSPTTYRGEIHYVPLTKNQTYWLIPLSSFTIGGVAIDIGTPEVAIDTGTSLIGGPAEALKTIFDAVPGSLLMTNGSFSGYWTVPCKTRLKISVQFGAVSWPLDPSDFNLGKVSSSNQCLTAFFTITKSKSGSAIPEWIFGAAFLKNVYSVFRASPPSIGFAQLSTEFSGKPTLAPTLLAVPPIKDGALSAGVGARQRSKVFSIIPAGLITSFVVYHLGLDF